MQSEKPEVTFLLTAHNEENSIADVTREFYEEISERIPLKVLVVEDGSTDATKDILLKLSREIPMNLSLGEDRRGYSKAVVEGLKRVDTEYTFFTDGDGQHLARDFWKLYRLKDDHDILSGWRVKRADSVHRKLMSTIFQRIAKILFRLPPLHDITAPYKLMRTEVAKEIASEFEYMSESFWTEFTIRAHRKGFKIAEIPVSHRKRPDGNTTQIYTIPKIPKIVISQLVALLKLLRAR